jgi:hypothetical protein
MKQPGRKERLSLIHHSQSNRRTNHPDRDRTDTVTYFSPAWVSTVLRTRCLSVFRPLNLSSEPQFAELTYCTMTKAFFLQCLLLLASASAFAPALFGLRPVSTTRYVKITGC